MYNFNHSDAWWCFPFEAMEALSCHLMWVAAATYCTLLSPKGLLATLIGVLGMAHFSLGRGSGSFCGGFLIGHVGTREAFRYMGLLAVIGGIGYFAIHMIWLRHIDLTEYDDEPQQDAGECEKLNPMDEPKTKEMGTGMSQERLSLMIKYNQIGSLTSLPRGSKVRRGCLTSHRQSNPNLHRLITRRVYANAARLHAIRKSNYMRAHDIDLTTRF